MTVKLIAAACSDKGRRRHNNEDNFCLNGIYMPRGEMDQGGLFTHVAQGRALYAVCDGMGGEEAGEDASLLSAQMCAKYLEEGPMSTKKNDLRTFMHQGCINVFEQAQRNENHSGSTVSLLIADDDGFYAANMGDSRLYHLTAKKLIQVSEDHTEVQRLLRLGEITKEQIKTHPKRHMIRQYWGMPLAIAPFMPYFSPMIPYVHAEKFLLCSDGLTDMLDDPQIEALLRQEKPIDQIAQDLVNAALENGGRDNVTVIVVQVEKERQEGETEKAPKKLMLKKWLLRIALLLLGIADIYVVLELIENLILR